jgi:hypothetical protein
MVSIKTRLLTVFGPLRRLRKLASSILRFQAKPYAQFFVGAPDGASKRVTANEIGIIEVEAAYSVSLERAGRRGGALHLATAPNLPSQRCLEGHDVDVTHYQFKLRYYGVWASAIA